MKVEALIYDAFSELPGKGNPAGVVLALVLGCSYSPVVVAIVMIIIEILFVVLFGFDLLLFNLFMPLVFDADIPDLIIRTCVDFSCITIGCFFLQKGK